MPLECEFGGRVEVLDLSDPRYPGPVEVVVEVAAAGVGNWDELVRTGEWRLGREAPMALGVEVAGTVIGVGSEVTGLKPGGEVSATRCSCVSTVVGRSVSSSTPV